jgi:hypothetical protein
MEGENRSHTPDTNGRYDAGQQENKEPEPPMRRFNGNDSEEKRGKDREQNKKEAKEWNEYLLSLDPCSKEGLSIIRHNVKRMSYEIFNTHLPDHDFFGYLMIGKFEKGSSPTIIRSYISMTTSNAIEKFPLLLRHTCPLPYSVELIEIVLDRFCDIYDKLLKYPVKNPHFVYNNEVIDNDNLGEYNEKFRISFIWKYVYS